MEKVVCDICGKEFIFSKFVNDMICPDFLDKEHTKDKKS